MCRDELICVKSTYSASVSKHCVPVHTLLLWSVSMTSCTPGRCARSAVHADAVHQILPARHFLLAQALLQMIVQLQQSGSLSTPTSGSAVVTAPHAEAPLTHPY